MRTGVAALAALALAAVSGASASTPVTRTLWTTGTVSSIAADGSRVAVATANLPKECDRIVVWRPLARRTIHWSAHTHCPGSETSGGQTLMGVALATSRVAWLESAAGNNQDMIVYTASLVGSKKAKPADFATNGNGAQGDPHGEYLGDLVGDGGVIGYDKWFYCTGDELPPVPPCLPRQEGVTSQRLIKLSPAGAKTTVKTGPQAYALAALDAGRFAVEDDAAGNVTLLDSSGRVLRTIAVEHAAHAGTALNGAQLATLARSTLTVYSTATGAPTKSLALTGVAPRLTDLQSGIAVYTAGRQARLVRLSDGRNRVAATAPAVVVGAQLERSGLWYAYNLASGKARGRVVFVPWASVLAKLR